MEIQFAGKIALVTGAGQGRHVKNSATSIPNNNIKILQVLSVFLLMLFKELEEPLQNGYLIMELKCMRYQSRLKIYSRYKTKLLES
jgi:hypothetical protein